LVANLTQKHTKMAVQYRLDYWTEIIYKKANGKPWSV